MREEALVLIDGETDAQRLVASWPQVNHDLRGDELLEDWERASGVFVDLIEKWEPVLFRNEIIGPEGMVAEEAVSFIRRKLTNKTPARKSAKES